MTRKVFLSLMGVLTLGLALAPVGCGAAGTKLHPVSGKVTFNGELLKEGRILFRMTGPGSSGRSYSGSITDGSYKLESEAGPAVVEITAYRPIPGKFDRSNGSPEPAIEMYIPTKYNSATTLKADVATKSNTIPFELTSKK